MEAARGVRVDQRLDLVEAAAVEAQEPRLERAGLALPGGELRVEVAHAVDEPGALQLRAARQEQAFGQLVDLGQEAFDHAVDARYLDLLLLGRGFVAQHRGVEEKQPVRKVELVSRLQQEIDQRVWITVVARYVEGTDLGNEELEVSSLGCSQVRIDPAAR